MAETNNQNSGQMGEELKNAVKLPNAQEFAETFERVSSVAREVNNLFGQSRQRIVELKTELVDSLPGIARLGGNIGDVGESIQQIALASRRNVVENSEDVEKLFAASKVLGASVGEISDAFLNVGVGIEQVGKQLEDSVNYVRSIGGNTKQVMDSVRANMDQMNRYQFEGGVQGLTKMAAQASMLRFDMGETFRLADKVLTPEGAIETAAAFQRLGVSAGALADPFALMNQSINDPGALQESLAKVGKQFTYFDEKTKSFRINPQGILTLKQMEKEAGLAGGTLSKAALASAELDKRLSNINPSINFKDESDKQFLSNLSEMDASGNYVVKISDQETKKLSDVTQQEFDKLITEQKNQPKSMEEIARAGMKTSDVIKNDVTAIKEAVVRGAVGTSVVKDNLEAYRKITTTPTGILSDKVGRTEIFNKQFETLSNSIRDAAKEMVKTDGKSMGDVMKDLGGKFGKQGDDVKKIVEQLGISVYKDIKGKDLSYRSSEIGDLANKALRGLESYVDDTNFGKKVASTGTKSGTTVKPTSGKSSLLEGTDAFTSSTSKDKTLTSTVNQTVDYTGTITFKVDAPSGVSTQYLTDFLNSEKFKEQIYTYVQEKNKQKEKTR